MANGRSSGVGKFGGSARMTSGDVKPGEAAQLPLKASRPQAAGVLNRLAKSFFNFRLIHSCSPNPSIEPKNPP